ncbi:NAD-dependent epimerase/dehydratase family protein [Priestia megaterium]|uniref:NAD-dependent epimerase/dehydratase family protein n=2 Tax=Priestia megaterium TaxID=1404 RepID=UPI000BED9CDA|nr:NAD-dependent epimerase/dehydratase family protein [Priestia megaterium]MDH6651294.1 UDP-glucose 4-epimerase [Bacillus sp. PvP124]MED4069399.1 GDP-mannose 4,6-dehydratase [Priestia megaterium]PEA37074.1 UDP-glucose 4-epimerase [Priestia megaterium]PEE43745.1 UDP-glucose 4-epimerase [Priestia megaterium]PFK42120.1 UDP-glucose 4-epimerase [Priestia megaterium]
MKAIVTGGAGFIGSHLVEELIIKGFEVHIIDSMISGKQENIHPLATLHVEDICSKQTKQIILKEKPNIVFHLAAQADVSRSINDPQYDADVNIKGTINILEACRDASVDKIIFASTSAVYGELQKDLITEMDPTVPISYYGLSKLTGESYIRLFSRLYGLSYTILRYGNVYGPRQTPKGEGGVVAVFLDRLNKGTMLNIHGDGEQTRDFVYVKDIVQANIAAIDKGHQEVIHASTTQRTSVNRLLKELEKIHGSKINISHTEGRPGDIKHSCLDSKKAYKLLEWQSQVSIFNGLKETYTFLKNNK